ncbi:GNAT family N-acetyltransferase [Spirillospora sp. CA-255316]
MTSPYPRGPKGSRFGGMVVTRLATAADVPAIAEVARAAYAVYVPRIGRKPPPMVADFAAAVAAGDTWVAMDAGVVGYMVLRACADHLLLENVAVRPDAQGRGVGGLLLALAEQRAAELGFDEVRLYTSVAMTENIAYYKRKGYVETHRSEDEELRRVFFTKRLVRS